MVDLTNVRPQGSTTRCPNCWPKKCICLSPAQVKAYASNIDNARWLKLKSPK